MLVNIIKYIVLNRITHIKHTYIDKKKKTNKQTNNARQAATARAGCIQTMFVLCGL